MGGGGCGDQGLEVWQGRKQWLGGPNTSNKGLASPRRIYTQCYYNHPYSEKKTSRGWSKRLLHLLCRPQPQTSGTHGAFGPSGRKQNDAKGRLQTPAHRIRPSVGPKSSYWEAQRVGTRRVRGREKAAGPLTSPLLALPEFSQALTPLKRLHVQDAGCVRCAPPTTNGARQRVPSANQRSGRRAVPPPSPASPTLLVGILGRSGWTH